MELISVIVPVYKVENYLNQCIQSIVNQTYSNLEIILVDDGSPDSCGLICDTWAQKDERIKVIHKKNGGLSDARNVGLVEANGKYIAFVDSDDWLNVNTYEVLFNNLFKANAEIACCKFMRTSDENIKEENYCGNESLKIYDKISAVRELILDKNIQQVVWNKLYKREVLENIKFAINKCHEDEFWSYQVLTKAKKVVVVNWTGYYYRQRSTSIMGEAYSLKRLHAIEAKCCRQKFLEENIPELVSLGKQNVTFSCLYQGQQVLLFLNDRNEKALALSKLKKVMRINVLRRNDLKGLPVTQKIWLTLASKIFILTCHIRNWLKIGL